MKARCPHCGGSGCSSCDGGYIEVRMKAGDLYTEECTECGFENGGSIADRGKMPTKRELYPCVMCGGETKWTLVEENFGGELE